MPNVPEISVVMPAWNAEQTISNAINSIRNQTLKNWELIVIDDGSQDQTAAVINYFNDRRIVYQWQSHQGLVAARNHGNELAQADIIAIQDADDLSLPDRLEKCLKIIHQGSDIVIHDAYINMWDAQFNCISRKYLPSGNPKDAKALLNFQTLTGWPVFRKSIWQLKPFRMETEFCYDWMMHLDWVFSGFNYGVIHEGLYEYVRQHQSASQIFEKDGRRTQSIIAIKEIMKKEYGQ